MKIKRNPLVAAGTALVLLTSALHAAITVTVDRNRTEDAEPGYVFKSVPRPARNDAASRAAFSLVDGRRDPNGGNLDRLTDGKVSANEDDPANSFFFTAGTDGGRLALDLGAVIDLKQVNTYSWHANTRGPQVYTLFASDGKAAGFNAAPARSVDPTTCGWALLATVDTRPKDGESGGQYGVSIGNPSGAVGAYRHLLFDIHRTEADDSFGNTFFSEIDVLDAKAPAPELIELPSPRTGVDVVEAGDGKYRITIDTSETPDLTDWTRKELIPMIREWYPRIVSLLPSEGYAAPTRVGIVLDAEGQGVAATSGTRVRCAAKWFRDNLKGEAKGAVFHELVHVVQQYGRARRQPGASPPPGWLVEGLADYVRWYHFEPESRGAEITKRNLTRARYDGSYRVTANFLDWASRQHGTNLVPALNAAMREGRYHEDLWKQLTGHTAPELGEQWKAALEKKLSGPIQPGAPVDYLPLAFQPETWRQKKISTQLLPWTGTHIVFLTTNGTYDPVLMTHWVARLDQGWALYADLTGARPQPFKQIDGRATIAAVPGFEFTCGAGCGYVGSTGIELAMFYRWNYPALQANSNAMPHYVFYEMGRNFMTFDDRHSAFATGYAVFMRYVCMDALGCTDDDAKTRQIIEDVEPLIRSGDMPFLKTFTNADGLSEKEPRVKDAAGKWIIPSDQPVTYAAAMLRLRREHGGNDWVRRFFAALKQCPPAKPDNRDGALSQSWSWLIAASVAAKKDLTPIFVRDWRLPLAAETQKELAAVDWSTATASSILERMSPKWGLEPTPSLRAAAHNLFDMGVGISDRIPERQDDWPLLAAQFNSVTPENCMKPDPVQVVEGRFNLAQPDAFVAFATAHQFKVVGHCLVWAKDDRTPPWFYKDGDQPASRELLLKRMKTHIDAVAGRYRGKIAMWDVVNEALDDGTNFLRPSGWLTIAGEEFIAKAFEYAHAADPNALLIYNDYNNELPAKREKLIRLVRNLQAAKAPVHAIGLQGHYEIDRVPYDDIEATLVAVKPLGVKVVVSELDIDVIPRGRWWADGGKYRDEMSKLDPYRDGCPPEILQRQAEQYARLFRLFRKHADVIARISFWNLHDGQSWLNGFPWQRVNHPLLFDRNRQPKPAFDAVLRELTSPAKP